MSIPKTIVVTGANRGIGHAICTQILSNTSLGPIKLFATTRKGSPLDFPNHDSTKQELVFPALDVEESESIRSFVDRVEKESESGKVDVLINNAGIYANNSGKDDALEVAEKILKVNYRGTREMCEHFIPHMAPQGRIVNMSSVASSVRDYSDAIRSRFQNPDISFSELDQLVEDYLIYPEDMKLFLTKIQKSLKGPPQSESPFGPPNRAYNVSKACVNVLTKLLAQENPSVTINACCPGWVATDMGLQVGRSPPKTPEQGARIPLRLAFGDVGGVSGMYWANESVRGKEEGRVQVWGPDGGFVIA